MSNQTKILNALRYGKELNDNELATVTGIPEPSVRRTRLHLVAAGSIIRSYGGRGWRLRKAWEMPDQYTGVQNL